MAGQSGSMSRMHGGCRLRAALAFPGVEGLLTGLAPAFTKIGQEPFSGIDFYTLCVVKPSYSMPIFSITALEHSRSEWFSTSRAGSLRWRRPSDTFLDYL